jgi:hypothetical protein
MDDDQSSHGSAQIDFIIDRFEQAWEGGEPPVIDAYLPDNVVRLRVLVELVHIDLERRIKAGEDIQVEGYLERFPDLAADAKLALDLISAEHRHRLRRMSHTVLADYGSRFPQWRDLLMNRLRSAPDERSGGRRVRLPVDLAPINGSRLSGDYDGPAVPKIAIPGYEILGELGRGGMGIVYRARDMKLDRLVALKTLRSDLQTEPQQLGRFRAEAKALGRLKHPNIVQIYEVGEHEGCPYIALELVDGGNLSSHFGRSARLEQAAPLIEVLARAIHAAHRANIIHRDLKPANVLISPSGIPKITDFGLAKQLGASVMTTQSGAILGTPSYMAPEQVAGKGMRITRRTDVYALGAILYELITGKPPFKERTVHETMLRVLNDEPVPPHELYPAVPRDLEIICQKCLEKDPLRRYRSALALAEDLRRFQAERPIKAEGHAVLERAGRWCGRHSGLVGFVTGVVVTAALAIGPVLMVYVLCPLIFAAFCFMAKVGRGTKLALAVLYLETWALAWLSLSWVAPAQALFSLLLILIVIQGDYVKRR